MSRLGQLRVAALVAASLAASSSDAATLDWSVADCLQGAASIDMAAASTPLALRVDIDGDCPTDPAFTLDGRPVAVRPAGGCGFKLPATAPGEHRLELAGLSARPRWSCAIISSCRSATRWPPARATLKPPGGHGWSHAVTVHCARGRPWRHAPSSSATNTA